MDETVKRKLEDSSVQYKLNDADLEGVTGGGRASHGQYRCVECKLTFMNEQLLQDHLKKTGHSGGEKI